MRKSLAFIVALVVLAFVGSGAQATTKLTLKQVTAVCDGNQYCEKKCGANGEHKCSFGCGTKGCTGECLTCGGNKTKAAGGAVDSTIKALGLSSPRDKKTEASVRQSSATIRPETQKTPGPPKPGLLDNSGSSASKSGSSGKTGGKNLTSTTEQPVRLQR